MGQATRGRVPPRQRGSWLQGQWRWASCLLFAGALLLSPAQAEQAVPSAVDSSEQSAQSAPAKDREVAELLVLANQNYMEGRYPEAAAGYESMIAQGHRNGHLYYNLANSYVRLGQTGKAILNYRKALLLLPWDGDLKANLQYARSLSQDRIEEAPSSLWRTLAFWYFGLNLRGLIIGFCLFNAVFWGSMLFRLFRDTEWLRWSVALSLLLCLAAGVSSVMKYRDTFHNGGGVVLTREAPVRSGFTREETVLFVLHEGAEFRVLGEEAGWLKIGLPDGKKGWLPADSAGRVSL